MRSLPCIGTHVTPTPCTRRWAHPWASSRAASAAGRATAGAQTRYRSSTGSDHISWNHQHVTYSHTQCIDNTGELEWSGYCLIMWLGDEDARTNMW